MDTPKLPEQVSNWMLKQLHLTTDNLHIRNHGFQQHVLSLFLYESDGKNGWIEKSLGKLKPDEQRWITLKPLSFSLAGAPPLPGESVLVVRTSEVLKKNQIASWRISNVDYSNVLYKAMYKPSKSFSRKDSIKPLWISSLKPRTTYDLDGLGFFGRIIQPDAHWEYWFNDLLIPNPLP